MEYEKQYKRIKQEAFEAILEGKNVIICGPSYSGKTHLLIEMSDYLRKKDYQVIHGILGFNPPFSSNKYWMEIDNEKLLDMISLEEDHVLIKTDIVFQDNQKVSYT
jgi:ABC-type lipoprotein export system ATPase subunit